MSETGDGLHHLYRDRSESGESTETRTGLDHKIGHGRNRAAQNSRDTVYAEQKAADQVRNTGMSDSRSSACSAPKDLLQEDSCRWLYLASCTRLPFQVLGRLHQVCPDALQAVSLLHASAPAVSSFVREADRKAVRRVLHSQEWDALPLTLPQGVTLTRAGHVDFPASLRPVEDWPPVLTVAGRIPSGTAVAIVGMRKASPHGKDFAWRLGAALARQGLIVVSGLAFGIDAAAHEGVLAAGGKGVAIMAGGLSRITPRSHFRLARRLVEGGGALVSHLLPDTVPYGWRFPIRNRLIAGLADAVVVVEAAETGGALSTARHARDLGREVLAVPGFPDDGHAIGVNQLLRDGAGLCCGPKDVMEVLGIRMREKVRVQHKMRMPAVQPGESFLPECSAIGEGAGLAPEWAFVLDQVYYRPDSLESVAMRSNCSVREVLGILIELEALGQVVFPSPATVQRLHGAP